MKVAKDTFILVLIGAIAGGVLALLMFSMNRARRYRESPTAAQETTTTQEPPPRHLLQEPDANEQALRPHPQQMSAVLASSEDSSRKKPEREVGCEEYETTSLIVRGELRAERQQEHDVMEAAFTIAQQEQKIETSEAAIISPPEFWSKTEEACQSAERTYEAAIAEGAESATPIVANEGFHQPLSTAPKARTIEPPERGGHPRTATDTSQKPRSLERDHGRPRSEIVCCKTEQQWTIGVELEEGAVPTPNVEVFHNRTALPRDDSKEGFWHLLEPGGQIAVSWKGTNGGLVQEHLAYGQSGYLLFKLSGPRLHSGRLVKSASIGSYLLITPASWQRDTTLSGHPPIAPEQTSLRGYSAHHFLLKHDATFKISMIDQDNRKVLIDSVGASFELVGNFVEDAIESIGPLFGSCPPRIRALREIGWNSISNIVIGEEGSGRGKWRTHLEPVRSSRDQEFPRELASRKGGWYFARIYDELSQLVESLDFRFLGPLKSLQVHQPTPLPSSSDAAMRVEFVHDEGCLVVPIPQGPSLTDIRREIQRTTVIIPLDPKYAMSTWQISMPNEVPIEVAILVERLWWALGEQTSVPDQWSDKVLELQKENFLATSSSAIWLKLPKERWLKQVMAGFEHSSARPYAVRVTETTLAIPLRDFGDARELRTIGRATLNLWVRIANTTHSCTVGQVIVLALCRPCGFKTPQQAKILRHVEDNHMDQWIEDLFPHVSYEELWRENRSLPRKIYKCSYCPKYLKTDDELHPTSAIIRHQEQECEKIDRGRGPIKVWSLSSS